MLQKVRKQGIRFWDERTFWHEIIYKSLIPTFGKPGADPGGGLWGLETPPSKLGLILKQALQIIIIGAKIIISICTFKRYRTMSEDSRKKQCTTDIRTFFASERLV